jgi:hypothetical protein
MRHLRLIGIALVAGCAIGASMADSGFALPTVLPETTKNWTGTTPFKNELWKLNGENKVTCNETTAEGNIEASKPLGMFHLRFKRCETQLLTKCTGTGDEAGVILELGSWHLVYDTLGANLNAAGVAVLLLVASMKWECPPVDTFEMKSGGMVLCLIASPTALTKTFEYSCTKANNERRPGETKYYNGAGTLVSSSPLLANENGGVFEEIAQLGLGFMSYGENVLIMI